MALTTLTYSGPGFSWTSDPGRVGFTQHYMIILGKTNRPNYRLERWTVRGSLQDVNPVAVDAKKNILLAAMQPYGDLVFSLGTYAILNANTLNGTIVKDFRWIDGVDPGRGSGIQALTRRDYQFVIEGMTALTSDTDIIEWRESVINIGDGGAMIKPVVSLAGTVQPQTVASYTPVIQIQSGYGVGLTATPSASTPIWFASPGVYYLPDKYTVEEFTPQNWGYNTNTGYGIRWSYTSWSNSPLVVSPPPI